MWQSIPYSPPIWHIIKFKISIYLFISLSLPPSFCSYSLSILSLCLLLLPSPTLIHVLHSPYPPSIVPHLHVLSFYHYRSHASRVRSSRPSSHLSSVVATRDRFPYPSCSPDLVISHIQRGSLVQKTLIKSRILSG